MLRVRNQSRRTYIYVNDYTTAGGRRPPHGFDRINTTNCDRRRFAYALDFREHVSGVPAYVRLSPSLHNCRSDVQTYVSCLHVDSLVFLQIVTRVCVLHIVIRYYYLGV